MGIEYNSKFCINCDTQKKVERKTANHVLHLLISVLLGIFTYGIGSVIWILIWILLSIKIGGWRCCTCGGQRFK